jgi:hypothetical protein
MLRERLPSEGWQLTTELLLKIVGFPLYVPLKADCEILGLVGATLAQTLLIVVDNLKPHCS